MRKMRKALSFALILALVLTSFSFVSASGIPVSAIPTLSDIDGLPGEEQIMAGRQLGYISGFPDGTFRPDEEVTRAQMAVLITGVMGIPESALTGLAARESFNDLGGYGWARGAINFCSDRNIVIGDGYGNFMPGRTVTKNEAMTMILRAIGYTENSEELVGRWPANYVALAQQKDLYADIVGTDVGMTRQNVAIALFNALVVEMVYVDLQGRTWVLNAFGQREWIPACLANTGLNCDVELGMMTPAYYGTSWINITGRIGGVGWIFTTKNTHAHGEGILVAFKMESEFLTGKLDGSRFKADDGTTYAFGNATDVLPTWTIGDDVYQTWGTFWNNDWDLRDDLTNPLPYAATRSSVLFSAGRADGAAAMIKSFVERENGDRITDGKEVTLA